MGGSLQQLGNHPLLSLLTVPWNCPGTSVSFCLQTGAQGLVEFDLSSWTNLILIGLCYALWAMSFFEKLCPDSFPPVSCSFPELHLGPQWCLYNILEGQPENSWPLGEKNVQYPSPLDSQPFIFHVSYNMQQQHLSVDPPGWVTNTQCLLEVHLLVASLQGQLGFQG